jgi:hypothetical protein
MTEQLELSRLHMPPTFCQYASGPCDQSFSATARSHAVLLYPSKPEAISYTIEQAAQQLMERDRSHSWLTWRDFRVAGQVVFCEICKSMRYTTTIVADVTTLNLNLLFEIGFALGLELPVVPIRDTSYVRDKEAFERLGLLDTLGYSTSRTLNSLPQSNVGVEHSFSFFLDRTLKRPRDLLTFLHRAIEIAINRGHNVVSETDIRDALKVYSEDILMTTSFELRDVFPELGDPLYVFIGAPTVMEEDEVVLRLLELKIGEPKAHDSLALLLWFGFLGVQEPRHEAALYSYDVRYNTEKLFASVRLHGGRYVIHPAFREALGCV